MTRASTKPAAPIEVTPTDIHTIERALRVRIKPNKVRHKRNRVRVKRNQTKSEFIKFAESFLLTHTISVYTPDEIENFIQCFVKTFYTKDYPISNKRDAFRAMIDIACILLHYTINTWRLNGSADIKHWLINRYAMKIAGYLGVGRRDSSKSEHAEPLRLALENAIKQVICTILETPVYQKTMSLRLINHNQRARISMYRDGIMYQNWRTDLDNISTTIMVVSALSDPDFDDKRLFPYRQYWHYSKTRWIMSTTCSFMNPCKHPLAIALSFVAVALMASLTSAVYQRDWASTLISFILLYVMGPVTRIARMSMPSNAESAALRKQFFNLFNDFSFQFKPSDPKATTQTEHDAQAVPSKSVANASTEQKGQLVLHLPNLVCHDRQIPTPVKRIKAKTRPTGKELERHRAWRAAHEEHTQHQPTQKPIHQPTLNNIPVYKPDTASHIIGNDGSRSFYKNYEKLDGYSHRTHKYTVDGVPTPGVYKIKIGRYQPTDQRFLLVYVPDIKGDTTKACYVVSGYLSKSHKHAKLPPSFIADMMELAKNVAKEKQLPEPIISDEFSMSMRMSGA